MKCVLENPCNDRCLCCAFCKRKCSDRCKDDQTDCKYFVNEEYEGEEKPRKVVRFPFFKRNNAPK